MKTYDSEYAFMIVLWQVVQKLCVEKKWITPGLSIEILWYNYAVLLLIVIVIFLFFPQIIVILIVIKLKKPNYYLYLTLQKFIKRSAGRGQKWKVCDTKNKKTLYFFDRFIYYLLVSIK